MRGIRPAAGPSLGEAAVAFLVTLGHPGVGGTRRVYSSTLRQLLEHLGDAVPVAVLDEPSAAADLAAWLTGGATLHQLRHSALTHAAEDGANTSILLSCSGHTSVASLARYTRVSPEALRHWQQQRDPAIRRR